MAPTAAGDKYMVRLYNAEIFQRFILGVGPATAATNAAAAATGAVANNASGNGSGQSANSATTNNHAISSSSGVSSDRTSM